MQWIVAQSYSVLGQNIRSTRIVCFLFGLLSIFGFFLLVKNLTNREAIWYLGTTMFSFSPVLFYYMMNPLPDLLAFMCVVWSMYFFVRANNEQKFVWFILGTAFLSLSTLSKLPYLVFSGIPLGLLILYIKSNNPKGRSYLLWSSLLMAPAIGWYLKTLPTMQNNAALGGVFSSTTAGDPILHALIGNLTYSLPVLYLGYAAIAPFLVGLYVLIKNRKQFWNRYLPFTITGLLLLLYFLYECNLISTVHDYYMLPFLPVIFLIVAIGLQFLFDFKILKPLILAIVASSPFITNAVIQPRWNPGVTEYCHDLFQFRDKLRNAVPDTALVVMGNDETMSIMPYYIDKKGWTYVDSELQKFNLECFIRDGATHLYTNSKVTLQDTSLRTLFKREIGVYGTIHIFELVPRSD